MIETNNKIKTKRKENALSICYLQERRWARKLTPQLTEAKKSDKFNLQTIG